MDYHCVIGQDHPSLVGHFPGDPIVPGVVILQEVCSALRQWRSQAEITGLPVVKFLAPLRPGVKFSISLEAADNAVVNFRCCSGERVLAQGRLIFDEP